MVTDFEFSRIPRLVFGAGKISLLVNITQQFGNNCLLITGKSSLESSGILKTLKQQFESAAVACSIISVSGEPTPELIDNAVLYHRDKQISVVIAVGGGSVIDTGKAISAMLLKKSSVLDYLEGVGTGKEHDGIKIPFIAVPTTSGSGSEATKNAVISRVGLLGFKKSLRHDNFVPDIALIDPELTVTCPSDVTAACGMDAFSQLMESYVSTNANPLTDALALSGIKEIKDNLVSATSVGARDISVRASMAYAAFLSGITLANAGLGIVHGLASAIGGMFPVPHGGVSATFMAPANKVTIEKLIEEEGPENRYLKKYAQVSELFTGISSENVTNAVNAFIVTLYELTEALQLPYLAKYGIKKSHVSTIVEKTGNKNNPIKLDKHEIAKIVMEKI